MYWISDLGIWYMYRFVKESRHWNAFGTDKPSTEKSNTIICEINSPPDGIDRRIAGAFARDPHGNGYLIHRGKLGGNYSKRTFEENYQGEWTTVIDGDREEKVVVIGKIDETLPEKIRDFVYEISRIKAMKADFNLEENFKKETGLYQHPGRGKGTGFYQYLQLRGYYFSPEIVENFLLSLKVKPFVILTGNSGTGKTKLAQLYGQYISTDKTRYLVVPVGANWTETRHIFGYLNIMTGKYQSTPALDFIMSADKDPDNPHILILDEMNLSHVERYFSDFLSAIESGEPVPLHDDPECDFPSKIKIPENLMVVGTVNVDETTYMFSPKVLDRANTIEFETLKPRKYLEGDPHDQGPAGNTEFLENIMEYNPEQLKVLRDDLHMIWDELVEELDFFHETLRGPGFDFGFRVTLEILRFMHAAWIYEKKPARWENWERYMDAQIKQKILPKIHGPERLLRDTLEELRKHCRDRFPESEKKLEEMQNTLKTQRYASFIR
ncbi:McrB family protein [Methanothermobacter sp. EMTCatA1]|uniref:McrB family protein n=1 Tax=Methanothermobacter sp. EMTCatA1 TaxID=2017966 RepID=UPI00257FFBC7|nr:McrB family protein [Methanothermobacter sp. EMTCatA1]